MRERATSAKPGCVRVFVAVCLGVLALLPVMAEANEGETALWQALRERTAFAIMRHAIAPGTGDPADFRIGDCTTQRNLSERGRAQAREIGVRFRANGIATARVMTSQWCRCRDTATELGLGPVEDLPALNSFFGRYHLEEGQTAALRDWLSSILGDQPLVLVTHQVNIRALTGRSTSSGEVIVARYTADGSVDVLGSL